MAISTKKVLHDVRTEKQLKEIIKTLGGTYSENDNCTCELLGRVNEALSVPTVKTIDLKKIEYNEFDAENRPILRLTEKGNYVIPCHDLGETIYCISFGRFNYYNKYGEKEDMPRYVCLSQCMSLWGAEMYDGEEQRIYVEEGYRSYFINITDTTVFISTEVDI